MKYTYFVSKLYHNFVLFQTNLFLKETYTNLNRKDIKLNKPENGAFDGTRTHTIIR